LFDDVGGKDLANSADYGITLRDDATALSGKLGRKAYTRGCDNRDPRCSGHQHGMTKVLLFGQEERDPPPANRRWDVARRDVPQEAHAATQAWTRINARVKGPLIR
jgi:hypothetical protein